MSILRKVNTMLAYRNMRVTKESERPVPKVPGVAAFNVQFVDSGAPSQVMFFLCSVNIGKNNMNTLLDFSTTNVCNHVIIYADTVSPHAIIVLESSQCTTEVVNRSDVEFDKCRNILVPTYRKLTEREVADLLKKHAVKKEQLPSMLRSDAMARYLGFQVGDVVLAVETTTYRLVVKG